MSGQDGCWIQPLLTAISHDRLERRSHSTQQILKSNSASLQVASFRFFQATWDESVRDAFSKMGERDSISEREGRGRGTTHALVGP